MAAAANRIDARVWRISLVVIVGSIMSILDTTIVNVALETLGRDLHATVSEIQWVVTGYMLSLAAVIPLTGWAARRFGAKRVYIVSLILFTAGSALCGLANSTGITTSGTGTGSSGPKSGRSAASFRSDARTSALASSSSSSASGAYTQPRVTISGPVTSSPVTASTVTITATKPSSARLRRSRSTPSPMSPTIPSTYW